MHEKVGAQKYTRKYLKEYFLHHDDNDEISKR